MSLLIVTDLDGTLLEHHSYSFEPAREALKSLADRGIQPIFNSSKTAAEIEVLQSKLDLRAPYICENGAALIREPATIASKENRIFGAGRDEWLAQIHLLRIDQKFRFEGFADWSVKELMRVTELDSESAELARKRQFTEPILWLDSEAALLDFQSCLQRLQLQLVEGGRFFSIQSSFNKATAMHWLREQSALEQESLIVALGDSPNDSEMLEAADIAVIVKSAKSSHISLNSPSTIIHTEKAGPAGWQEAIHQILACFDAGEYSTNVRKS